MHQGHGLRRLRHVRAPTVVAQLAAVQIGWKNPNPRREDFDARFDGVVMSLIHSHP